MVEWLLVGCLQLLHKFVGPNSTLPHITTTHQLLPTATHHRPLQPQLILLTHPTYTATLLHHTNLPVADIPVVEVHAHQILPALLVVPPLHLRHHYPTLAEVKGVEIVGAAGVSASYSLRFGLKERVVDVFVAEDYQSVVVQGGKAVSVDERVADAHQTLEADSIGKDGDCAVAEILASVCLCRLPLGSIEQRTQCLHLQIDGLIPSNLQQLDFDQLYSGLTLLSPHNECLVVTAFSLLQHSIPRQLPHLSPADHQIASQVLVNL